MFLNPLMLWGLVGIAIPIIIHLLNRFRRRRVEWGAMDLLRRALVMRSRQIQMEDLLILLLRCLAVALIALALARPRTRASNAVGQGTGQQVAAVIAVDASFSMAHKPGVQSRFDRARQTVQMIQKTLSEGDPVSLVLLGNKPHILLRNLAYHENRFTKVLEEAKPLPERLNLENCLEQVAALVEESKGAVRECYLLTDAQALSWGSLSEKSRGLLNKITTQANVFFLTAAPESGANLTLSSLTLGSGALRKGTAARYFAEVRNHGPRAVEKVAVTLMQNDRPVDRRLVDRIEPHQAATVPLFARFETSGNVKLAAVLEQDELALDNTRYAVAPVRERVRVLCVDGAPSNRPGESATHFVKTALAPGRSAVAPSLAVDTVSWLQFSVARLGDYDLVILANVPDLRAEQAQALHDFTRQGGGLVVFLGDKVNGPLLNERLQTGSAFLLPAEVMEKVTAPKELAEGWPIEAASATHPLSRILRALPPALMSEVHLRQHFKVTLLPGAQSILQVGGTAAPLLLEKRVGQGRVLLFTSSADRTWNDLPAHPAFPILLQEMVTYLTGGADDQSVVVGGKLVLPLPAKDVQASVTLRDPAGGEFPVQVIERQGRRVAEYDQAGLPGFYEVRSAESNATALVAVNVDAAEGDVRALPAEDMQTALSGLRVRLVKEAEDLALVIRESRIGHEWWRVLLGAALAVLVLEVFLAWHFSRRMRVVEQSPRGRGEESFHPQESGVEP